MKKYIFGACLIIAYLVRGYALAEDEHGHDHSSEKKPKAESTAHKEHGTHEDEKEEAHEAEHKHTEGESEGHGHGNEHEHGEEENTQVGPNKGILAASEAEGIKLGPDAEKNFEIKKIKISGANTYDVPKEAVVTAGIEVNLYRYREGFYKRIDFDQVGKSGGKITIRSKDLKSGDEIAITGLGFLRIAEIAAFGGAPEGHSH
ncbi:MAG: hypothetical protein B7Y39_04205 [Bdellovibrio sp. 28-41-41]|nr:MAG: hypothetical protein B7Y39_04205 [Bdellovibrio sp. 28-41-41]